MSLSILSRSTRHFYLNYHSIESSSFNFPASFVRHIQFAFRLVITFLIGGFLAYATVLRTHLTQGYMLPNIGILTIQETFGGTMSHSWQIATLLVPLSIFLLIVQKIGLSHHHYVASEVLMLITSFFISYQCRPVMSIFCRRKKVSVYLSVLAANKENLSSVQCTLFCYHHQSRNSPTDFCARITGNFSSWYGYGFAGFDHDFSSFLLPLTSKIVCIIVCDSWIKFKHLLCKPS